MYTVRFFAFPSRLNCAGSSPALMFITCFFFFPIFFLKIQASIKKRLVDHLQECGGNAVVVFDEIQKVLPGTLEVRYVIIFHYISLYFIIFLCIFWCTRASTNGKQVIEFTCITLFNFYRC
jgi:preprotein translocase subunit SecY